MEEFFTAEDPAELFTVAAEVTDAAIERFERQEALLPDGSEIKIRTLFRGISRIVVGEPIVLPLAKLITAQGETAPADIQLQSKDYEFHLVQLSCTFDAGDGCRFHDARFEFHLRNQDPRVGAAEQPIVYDLAPDLITDQTTISRKYKLGPELKLELGVIKASIAAGDYEQAKEYMTYAGRIQAFGLFTSNAGWKFARTRQQEISALYRLFAVIRRSKGVKTRIEFGVGGRVEAVTGLGPIGPLPLSTTLRSGSDQAVLLDAMSRKLR